MYMYYVIVPLIIFIIFFPIKYATTFLYENRYLKIIIIDTAILAIYPLIASIFIYLFNVKEDIIIILLFWFILPYLYAFIKPKILRRYFNWEVGMYYPITEFLTLFLWYIISSQLIFLIFDYMKISL